MMKADKKDLPMFKKAEEMMKGNKLSKQTDFTVGHKVSKADYHLTDKYLAQMKSSDERLREMGERSLFEAYQPLIASRCQRFENTYNCAGLTNEDLVQSGNEGILRALESYDAKKGKFSTYVTNWIDKYIRDEVNRSGSTSRVPEKKRLQISKMKKLEVKSYKKFYKVNDQWIEEQMHISPKQHKTLKLTDQNVINSISSDTPVTDDTTIANFLGDNSKSKHKVETYFTREDIVKAMQVVLNPREQQIVTYYMDGMKFTAMGKRCGITEQRANQVFKRACEKLRPELIDYSKNGR